MNEIRDRRPSSWFWMDKDILDHYGPRIGAYGVAVYALLARYADNNGHAFPSLNAMVKLLGLSKQSIHRTLDALVNVGVISRGERKAEKGNHISNIYTLLHVEGGSTPQVLPTSKNTVEFPGGSTPQVGGSTPQVLGGSTPQVPEQDLPLRNKRDPLEQEENIPALSAPKPERYSPGFQQFWESYPVKKEKGKAWKSWTRQKLEPLTDLILTSIADHDLKDTAWRDGYIKYPATFLNGGCWTDVLPTAPRPNGTAPLTPATPPKPCTHKDAALTGQTDPQGRVLYNCPRCGLISDAEFQHARGLTPPGRRTP